MLTVSDVSIPLGEYAPGMRLRHIAEGNKQKYYLFTVNPRVISVQAKDGMRYSSGSKVSSIDVQFPYQFWIVTTDITVQREVFNNAELFFSPHAWDSRNKTKLVYRQWMPNLIAAGPFYTYKSSICHYFRQNELISNGDFSKNYLSILLEIYLDFWGATFNNNTSIFRSNRDLSTKDKNFYDLRYNQITVSQYIEILSKQNFLDKKAVWYTKLNSNPMPGSTIASWAFASQEKLLESVAKEIKRNELCV